MAAVSLLSKRSTWHVSGHSISIEYPLDILADINRGVIDGLNRFRRGGIEVGGVLFGVFEEERVRILAFRAIDCEHAFGPNFLLSTRDRLAIEELLTNAQTDQNLRGQRPVGWYRSRTRKGIHLSPEDVEIFDRYFPESWQIALVLRPEPFVPTKAGFFFREPTGSMRTESSYAEFSLSPPSEFKADSRPELKQVEPPSEIQKVGPEHSQDRPAKAQMAVVSVPLIQHPSTGIPSNTTKEVLPSEQSPGEVRQELKAQPSSQFQEPGSVLLFQSSSTKIPTTNKSVLYAVALGIVLTGLYFGMARNVQPPSSQTSLSVEERGGQLWIGWDPKRWETGGAKARLEIHEGEHVTSIDLDKMQLRSGSVTYARLSGNVWIRMQSEESEEWVAFLGRSVDPPGAKTDEEEEAGRQQLIRQADEIKRLEQLVANHNNQEKGNPTRMKGRPFLAPAKQARPMNIPSLEAPPIERIGWPTTPLALVGHLAESAPIPPPPREMRVRTGTLIWTGRLARNGVLTIDGNRSSTGALTGEVPGIPVRVRVHPAELTKDGLTVYMADTEHPNGYSEPAGPTNGWNRTRYLLDPIRARSLSIAEPPSAMNGWKRLVLRSNQSTPSIILVGWEVL